MSRWVAGGGTPGHLLKGGSVYIDYNFQRPVSRPAEYSAVYYLISWIMSHSPTGSIFCWNTSTEYSVTDKCGQNMAHYSVCRSHYSEHVFKRIIHYTAHRLLTIIFVQEIAAGEQYLGKLKQWWERCAPLSSPAAPNFMLQQHKICCWRWCHTCDDAQWLVWAGLTGEETRTAHACCSSETGLRKVVVMLHWSDAQKVS